MEFIPSDHCGSDTQISCSSFATNSDICTAGPGSPVLCRSNLEFSGILLNNGSCEESINGYTLKYHSIDVFQSWIDEVLKADSYEKVMPTNYVVSIMEVYELDLRFKCLGTVISENHVLTSAYCASTSSYYQVAVRARYNGNWLSNSK